MATSKIFSVFDSKAAAYLPPTFMQSRGVAIRSFGAAASDDKHEFCRFASDFTLFELGEFDDSNGSFTLHSAPIPLGTAFELKAQTTNT
nr:MAG: nonstructural protein [Microvirus sp.]